MNFKELRQMSGMNLTQFSKYFGIPYRTIQNWERGERQCPQYLIDLMEYKLNIEQSQIIASLPDDPKEIEFIIEQLKKEKQSWK